VKLSTTTFISQNKNIARIALATGLLLLVPLIAMQFTDEVNWTLGDFFVAGVLLFGSGLTYELFTRKKTDVAYRAAVGVAVFTSLLLVWVNLAVGIIGSEDNPANMLFGGVLLIGLIGAAIAKLRPQGMSRTLSAMAFAQFLVPVAAVMIWPTTSWGAAGMSGVFVFNAFFALLFAVSGLLFRRASKDTESGKL